jgi:hypothetical protein
MHVCSSCARLVILSRKHKHTIDGTSQHLHPLCLRAASCALELLGCCSNRSAALLKLNKVAKALADAEECVKLDPAFHKGYMRMALALESQQRLEEVSNFPAIHLPAGAAADVLCSTTCIRNRVCLLLLEKVWCMPAGVVRPCMPPDLYVRTAAAMPCKSSCRACLLIYSHSHTNCHAHRKNTPCGA